MKEIRKGIYISIKPKYLRLIESGEKTYEFRNYYPKEKIDILYVYESSPTCQLKYIIELGNVIKRPNKINEMGIGNEEFNQGIKTKYAYQIKSIKSLEEPIELNELRKKYKFTAPQAFAYDTKYPELTEDINKKSCIKIK